MRQTTLSALFAATILLATSCGPSESEKIAILQAQKAKNDSVRIAEIRAVKDEEAYKASLRDSLSLYTTLLTRQQTALTQLRTNIISAGGQPTQTKTLELTNLQFAVQHSQDQISQFKRQLSH